MRQPRTPRQAGGTVTARAVAIFREGAPLAEGRKACIRSSEQCTHPECDRYSELRRELHAELGLEVFTPSPLDHEGTMLLAHPDPERYLAIWRDLRATLSEAAHESA